MCVIFRNTLFSGQLSGKFSIENEALMVAKRFQDSLRKNPAVEDSDIAQLRASVGIATTNKFGGRDSRQLFLQANEALKVSKQYGKNRIAFYDPSTRQVICHGATNKVE